jgi:hypothetical protein
VRLRSLFVKSDVSSVQSSFWSWFYESVVLAKDYFPGVANSLFFCTKAKAEDALLGLTGPPEYFGDATAHRARKAKAAKEGYGLFSIRAPMSFPGSVSVAFFNGDVQG